MRDAQSQLDELDILVKVITFDDDVMAKNYVMSSGIDWPLLLDRNEDAYNAYGLQRANWWTLYNPFTILKYIWLIITGTPPGRPGKDWHRLGGDVLIDPKGIVKLHYRSNSPHDRPSVDSILSIVRQSNQT